MLVIVLSDPFPQFHVSFTFATNFFQVSHQLNAEVAPTFYGTNISSSSVSRNCMPSSHTSTNVCCSSKDQTPYPNCTAQLRSHTGQFHLPIACSCGRARGDASKHVYVEMAITLKMSVCCGLEVFMLAAPWMHALGMQRRNSLAVFDVIELPATSSAVEDKKDYYTTKEGQEEFREELAEYLTERRNSDTEWMGRLWRTDPQDS
jgi:hypothetical protein